MVVHISLEALLEADSNLQASPPDSKLTSLHFAVEHGSEDPVRILRGCEADIGGQSRKRATEFLHERDGLVVERFAERLQKIL